MYKLPLLSLALLFSSLCFSQNGYQPKNTQPVVLGWTDEIQSKELNEKRTLNIYLPPGYDPADTTELPVVYLLDGGFDEDFIHITGLYQFNTFEWINRVPKSIVVGIVNTDRKRDFTFPSSFADEKKAFPTTGGSANFIHFLEKELQPYIHEKYNGKMGGTLIGQSLGGLLASEILLKNHPLFSTYIIISPSLWWDNGSLLKTPAPWLNEKLNSPVKVYIGVGKEGASPGARPRIMEEDAKLLVAKLQAAKNKNLTIFFDYLPAENHATASHPAVFNALRLLNPVKE